jgi:hypothetical protein
VRVEVPAATEEVLRRVRKFLYDLNARLTYFPPTARASYTVEGFGELAELQPTEFRLNVPREPRMAPLSLGYTWRGSGPDLVVQVAVGRLGVQHYTDYLSQHGLTYRVSVVYPDGRAPNVDAAAQDVAFHLAPVVPVSVDFDVDRAAGGLRLTAWNLERLGRVSYPLPLDSVDEALLTELERAIRRDPNRLATLAGFEVADEVRERLRQRIYLDARRKALELAASGARDRPKGLLACLVRGKARNP